jgi:hypothetical protein
VNSGRLSVLHTYLGSPLDSGDHDTFSAKISLGAACIDVLLTGRAGPAWLIDQIGNRFVCIYYAGSNRQPPYSLKVSAMARPQQSPVIGTVGWPLTAVPEHISAFIDIHGLFAQRFMDATLALCLFRQTSI